MNNELRRRDKKLREKYYNITEISSSLNIVYKWNRENGLFEFMKDKNIIKLKYNFE